MYDYTTVTRERLHGYDKFLCEKRVPSTVARRTVYDYFHDVREPLPSTLEDPVGPEHPRDMNNYFHYDMYHYRRHVQLLPTTTRERLLPLHRTELDPPRKRSLQRYNRRERPPWTECMC